MRKLFRILDTTDLVRPTRKCAINIKRMRKSVMDFNGKYLIMPLTIKNCKQVVDGGIKTVLIVEKDDAFISDFTFFLLILTPLAIYLIIITIIKPPRAHAIILTYHSILFGAHKPILSPTFNPKLFKPAANLSACR